MAEKTFSKKAFTLVELVIVIAILAILAAIAIPTVSHLIAQANAAADSDTAGTMTTVFKTMAAEISTSQSIENSAKYDRVDKVLNRYGLQLSILTPKTSGNEFYYSNGTNNFVCAKDKAEAASIGGGVSADWLEVADHGLDGITFEDGKGTMTSR